jgi:hypothetical protein
MADEGELSRGTNEELIQELHRLRTEADELRREIDEAVTRFTERRKLGINRRKHSRSDRRKNPQDAEERTGPTSIDPSRSRTS